MRLLLILTCLLLAAPAAAQNRTEPGGAVSASQNAVLQELDHNRWPRGRFFVGLHVKKWTQRDDGRYVSVVNLRRFQVEPLMDEVVTGYTAVSVFVPALGPLGFFAMGWANTEQTGAEEGSGSIYTLKTPHTFEVEGLLPKDGIVALWLDFEEGPIARPVTVVRGQAPGLVHGVDPFVLQENAVVEDLFHFTSLGAIPADPGFHAAAWSKTHKALEKLPDVPGDQAADVRAARTYAQQRVDGEFTPHFFRAALQQIDAQNRTPTYDLQAGWLLWKMGKSELAADHLARYLEVEPDHRQIRLLTGQAQRKAGRRDQAWATLLPLVTDGEPLALHLCADLAGDNPARTAICAHASGGGQTLASLEPVQRKAVDLDGPTDDEADLLKEWRPKRSYEGRIEHVRAVMTVDDDFEPQLLIEVRADARRGDRVEVAVNPPRASWTHHEGERRDEEWFEVRLPPTDLEQTYFVVRLHSADGGVERFGAIDFPLDFHVE